MLDFKWNKNLLDLCFYNAGLLANVIHYKGALFPAATSVYRCKYGGCKNITSMTLVFDGDVVK